MSRPLNTAMWTSLLAGTLLFAYFDAPWLFVGVARPPPAYQTSSIYIMVIVATMHALALLAALGRYALASAPRKAGVLRAIDALCRLGVAVSLTFPLLALLMGGMSQRGWLEVLLHHPNFGLMGALFMGFMSIFVAGRLKEHANEMSSHEARMPSS